MKTTWYRVAGLDELPEGQVMVVTAGVNAVCLVHSKTHGLSALDNRCPHQGGPLGEGQLGPLPNGNSKEEWVICPWHGYEYDPKTGESPEGFGDVVPSYPLEIEDAVICVDVGNNSYSFGRFFECSGQQDVLMSGYLGSIGFGFPAAMGAWAAVGNDRKVVSISGDGGFGQYMGEFLTAAKYQMPICHILLNNDELGKISKEQRAERFPVWQTSLHNPNFAEYAELCGGYGFRATHPAEVAPALEAGLTAAGPAIVEILTDPRQT